MRILVVFYFRFVTEKPPSKKDSSWRGKRGTWPFKNRTPPHHGRSENRIQSPPAGRHPPTLPVPTPTLNRIARKTGFSLPQQVGHPPSPSPTPTLDYPHSHSSENRNQSPPAGRSSTFTLTHSHPRLPSLSQLRKQDSVSSSR